MSKQARKRTGEFADSKATVVTSRLPNADAERLQRRADAEGRTVSEVARDVLTAAVREG